MVDDRALVDTLTEPVFVKLPQVAIGGVELLEVPFCIKNHHRGGDSINHPVDVKKGGLLCPGCGSRCDIRGLWFIGFWLCAFKLSCVRLNRAGAQAQNMRIAQRLAARMNNSSLIGTQISSEPLPANP